MGTTTDKLNKLIETKEAIKAALSNKGVSITDTDTFYSYAEKINSIPSVNYETVNLTLLDVENNNLSGVTVTLYYNNSEIKQYTYTGNSLSIKIPEYINYTIKFDAENIYFNEEINGIALSNNTRELTVYGIITGLYIYSIDGNFYTEETWDTTNNSQAIGVALINKDCRFVIDKTNESTKRIDENNPISNPNAITSIEDSFLDYNGKTNTEELLRSFNNSEYAQTYCNSITYNINDNVVKGYLGSTGEWYKAISYNEEINELIELIGGTPLKINQQQGTFTNAYLSSTVSNNLNGAIYVVNFSGNNINNYPIDAVYNNTQMLVRPFIPLL